MLWPHNTQSCTGATAFDASHPEAISEQAPAARRAKVLLKLYRTIEKTDPQVLTCAFCLLVILLLELAHPNYFFGDDNMQFTFVQMTEIARNIVHGENLFINHHIFGGGFDMRNDPVFLYLWHPLVLLCSLLTLTRWKFWTMDVLLSIYLVAAGWAMARLLVQLRSLKYLRLSNTLVVFLSASYACSGYAVVVGASWGHFVANIASLPMFLLGLFHPRITRGVGWVAFAALLGSLAGSVDPLCHSLVFLTVFAVLLAWRQGSLKPLIIFAAGMLLTLLLTSPLLWHAWCGFRTATRGSGLEISVASRCSMPGRLVLAGYFLGWFAHWFAEPVKMTFFVNPYASFVFPFGFSSALVLVCFRRRCNRDALAHAPLLLALFSLLLVIYPPFLARLMAYVPLFRSFSAPFRQLMFFHFFMVLWLAFNIGRVSLRDSAKLMVLGLFIFGFSLVRLGHTLLSDFGDRKFLLSGRADRFYAEVRRDMPADAVLVTIGDPRSWFFRYPLCLAGGNDFPALYGITVAGGYSPTKPLNSEKTKIPGDVLLSFFGRDTLPALLRTYPSLYVIELAPHSCVRLGPVDSAGKFIRQPKTIDFELALSATPLKPEQRMLHDAPVNWEVFTNSPFGDGSSRAAVMEKISKP